MKRKEPSQTYPRLIFWNDEDETFVATIPGLSHVSAHGVTPEEAARELDIAFNLCQQAATDNGLPSPMPADLPALSKAAALLNMSELARRVGIRQSTLATKLARGTHFKDAESKAIYLALREAGLLLMPIEM